MHSICLIKCISIISSAIDLYGSFPKFLKFLYLNAVSDSVTNLILFSGKFLFIQMSAVRIAINYRTLDFPIVHGFKTELKRPRQF